MNARGAAVGVAVVGDTPLLGACVTWILSAAPFFFAPSAFEGVSRAALAALPWIAVAGLPRRDRGGGFGGIAVEIALLVPPLALGARLDLAAGMERAHLGLIVAASLVFTAALSFAAREAASERRARGLYAWLWFAFVAGVPILCATLALGGASLFGPPPAILARIAAASPLQWICARLPVDELASAIPYLPLATLVLLVSLGLLAARARHDTGRAP